MFLDMCRFILILVVHLLSSALTQHTDYSACGRDSTSTARARRHGKIVGGKKVAEGEFPWLVSLTRSGGHFCAGTLVNQRWVLSAAHCMCSGTDVLGTASMRVVLGAHDLREGGDLTLPVKRLLLHPKFRCARYDNDIALLELEVAVPWSATVRPACFPPDGAESLPQHDVTVAGWGWTHEDGVRSDVPLKVVLPVVGNEECTEWYQSQGKKLVLQPSQMCAGLEQGGRDACWADSGGPLMEANLTVVGVVSTGVGCARPRLPGIYTRVRPFLSWIAESISSTPASLPPG